MLGIIYLLLCAAFGICVVGLTVPDVRRLYIACSSSAKTIEHIPNTLFTVPAGIITGMLCVPFFNYYVTLGLSYIIDSGELCKKLGVLITFAFFIWMILTCLILINRKRIKREEEKAAGATSIEDYKFNIVDSIFYGAVILVITVASTFLMFYTYRINGDLLLNGYSTFSDLSPHTAMVSSFGKGFNFPTQYMHFSGDGIQYHFLFYYFAGVLQYLGLPIDYALNLPSIISMVCALDLLGLIAVLISSRRVSFLVAPILVFFRSSMNVFYHFKELISTGNTPVQAAKAILGFSSWYKVTEYDDWGIWAINVYPNQRHLMLGIAVILIMIILFLPFVRRLGISISRSASFGEGIKAFAFCRNAWISRSGDPLYPVSLTVLACLLVIVMPYFHGSCLIAMLLILFGMALVSENRLSYLAVAVCAVASAYAQTMAFSGGYNNVVSFTYHPGFVVDFNNYTIEKYLIIVTGATLVLAFIFAITALIVDMVRKKPVHRFLLFLCTLNPLIFAFLFQVSLEVLANHKFIQISLILADAFVAALIANLLVIPFKRRKNGVEESTISSEHESAVMIGGIAIAADSADIGSLTKPAAASAFGEALTEPEETDIKALEEHTGIDADLSDLAEGTIVDDLPVEVIEEELPAELVFGDEAGTAGEESVAADIFEVIDEENADTASSDNESADESVGESDNESETEAAAEEATGSEAESDEETSAKESEEAKAGVAAIAALFGEDVVEETPAGSEEIADITEVTEGDPENASETEVTELTEINEVSDTDGADEALKESAIEPAHAAMRPGSLALQQIQLTEEELSSESVISEEELPSESLLSIEAETEEETAEAASAAVSSETQINPESLKHEPIKPKKQKGLPLPAWIALELVGVLLAIALMVPLTATGVSEWATYVNINKTPLTVNADSPVTKWVLENTDPSDVFLTPNWSMNRFLLAGRPMYYGWPYYAWSAGHDTDTRNVIYLWLISGCDGNIDEFTRYCKERNIRYLVADPEFDTIEFENGVKFNRQFFEENLTQVAYFAEEDTTIYKIY